jgi:hypothetical protein
LVDTAERSDVRAAQKLSSPSPGASLRVLAFAASGGAVIEDGSLTARGFPLTSVYVASFPARITVPLVLAVHAQTGSDHDPRRYIVARSPLGERLNVLECSWHWPDPEGEYFKFRVFAPQLTITVQSAGVYTIGLCHSPDATEPAYAFPLPVKARAAAPAR